MLNQSGKQSYFHTFIAKCFNANLEDQLNLIYFARNLGSYYLPSVINQSFRHTSRFIINLISHLKAIYLLFLKDFELINAFKPNVKYVFHL